MEEFYQKASFLDKIKVKICKPRKIFTIKNV